MFGGRLFLSMKERFYADTYPCYALTSGSGLATGSPMDQNCWFWINKTSSIIRKQKAACGKTCQFNDIVCSKADLLEVCFAVVPGNRLFGWARK